MVSAAPDLIIFFYGFCSTWRTIGMLVTHFLYIMASVSHLRATLTNPGKASCTQTHSIKHVHVHDRRLCSVDWAEDRFLV